jgi:hypothetical protein
VRDLEWLRKMVDIEGTGGPGLIGDFVGLSRLAGAPIVTRAARAEYLS